jgi:hypothetical protein
LDTIYTPTGDSSQWEQTYTTVSSQSAGWGGEFGTQGATAYTILQNTSSNWDSVYATVSGSSATWDLGGGGTNAWSEITGTPTTLDGYGITDAVYLSTFDTEKINWNSTYDIVLTGQSVWGDKSFSSITGTPITLDGYGITDAVVLSNFESLENLIETNSGDWDSVYTSVETKSGDWDSTKTTVETNSGNWKSVYTDVNAKSGDWNAAYNLKHQGGDLVVNCSLTAIGPANQISTTFTTTSALCVVTLGQGPSLYVEQDTTYNNVASFVDSTTGIVLYVGRVNNVGINTDSSELSGLTVSGNISSSNIVYSLNGNSSNWNSSYTTLTSNSANWNSSYNALTSTSANWNSGYNKLTSSSAAWDGAVFNSYTVFSNSPKWDSSYNTLTSNSANWNSSYTTLTSNSANWNSSYTTLTSNSANWNSSYTTLTSNSANWNSSYTTLTSNSANWRNSYNSLTSTSSNWNSSYTTLTSNSGDWISKNNTVLSSLSVTQNVTVTGNVVASVLSASRFTGNSSTTNTQTTTNYNLLSSDNGKVLTFNNSNPITVNVLSGLGAGYSVSLIQLNTGQITISGGSGVTINSFGNVTKTAGQFAGASLYAYIADTFCLNGALTS